MEKVLLLLIIFIAFFSGCLNPFAPEEGELSGDLWKPQVTVGEMLQNFQTAYSLRDSLRYADLIADEFVFQYWDNSQPGHERYDQWYRETELKATGGMMRAYDRLDLRWGDYSAMENFSFPDSAAEFYVRYNLVVENYPPLTGFAYFRTRMGEDGRFRIVMWRDDF